MIATVPKAGTSQEEGPEGGAKDAIRPWLGEVAKPIPLDPVQLDHIDGSPSRTWSQCWRGPGSWAASADLNLGPLPNLGPDIEHFLWEPAAIQVEEEGNDPLQEPPVTEYENWIVWRSCQVHIPDWRWELVGIPGIDDFQVLVQKIRAYYEVLQARSKAQKDNNNYMFPPNPECICQKAFLPPQDPRFPHQDYREGKMQKTLAYAQCPPVLGREG